MLQMWFSSLDNLKRKQLEWLKRMCVLCTRFVRNICITKHETFKNKLTDRLVKSRPKSDGCQHNARLTLEAMHKTIYRRLDKHHMADCLWTLSHLRFVIASERARASACSAFSNDDMCYCASCGGTFVFEHFPYTHMRCKWNGIIFEKREKNIFFSLSHFLSIWIGRFSFLDSTLSIALLYFSKAIYIFYVNKIVLCWHMLAQCTTTTPNWAAAAAPVAVAVGCNWNCMECVMIAWSWIMCPRTRALRPKK